MDYWGGGGGGQRGAAPPPLPTPMYMSDVEILSNTLECYLSMRNKTTVEY